MIMITLAVILCVAMVCVAALTMFTIWTISALRKVKVQGKGMRDVP